MKRAENTTNTARKMIELVSTIFLLTKEAISTEKTRFENKNTEKLKRFSKHFMKNEYTATSFPKLILRPVKIIYLNINFVNKKRSSLK